MSEPFFPPHVIEKIKKLGLFEWQILDVYYHGNYLTLSSGTKAAIKKYQGYEIGLCYGQNKKTGEFKITTVWKRERR